MSDQFTRIFNRYTREKKNSISRKDGNGRTMRLTFEGTVENDDLETVKKAAAANGAKVTLAKKIDDNRAFNRSGTATGKNAAALVDFLITGEEKPEDRGETLEKAFEENVNEDQGAKDKKKTTNGATK